MENAKWEEDSGRKGEGRQVKVGKKSEQRKSARGHGGNGGKGEEKCDKMVSRRLPARATIDKEATEWLIMQDGWQVGSCPGRQVRKLPRSLL